MNIIVSQKAISSYQGDLLILPITTTTLKNNSPLFELNDKSNNAIKTLIKDAFLKDEKGSLAVLPKLGKLKTKRLCIVHLGPEKNVTLDSLRHAMGDAIRTLPTTGDAAVSIVIPTLPLDDKQIAQAMVEGTILGNYIEKEHKSEPEITTISELTLIGKRQLQKSAERGRVIAEANCLSRDLANAPANHLTPALFVKKAKTLLKGTDVSVNIIDEKKAKALGMNTFLAVGQGSSEPSYMLELSYTPLSKQKPIALVGKGVTFDTGGVSLKPANGMGDMKADMSGGAAVLATMVALSKLKPKKNVIALIPLVENMNSGNALKPGDVITSMSGKTIEITNTDAEGRLVMADAIHYATTKKPSAIIDIATLTGACGVALGREAAGILGTDQKLIDKLISLSSQTGEKLWQLPLYDEFLEYLKSTTADILNSAPGRHGGTCTAAKFLQQFTADIPWVHIDIASLMVNTQTKGYKVKGMSGAGARNLIELLA